MNSRICLSASRTIESQASCLQVMQLLLNSKVFTPRKAMQELTKHKVDSLLSVRYIGIDKMVQQLPVNNNAGTAKRYK